MMGFMKCSLVLVGLLALSCGTFAQQFGTRISTSGGLFGSGSESEGDLSAGDNSGSAGEANGYLPPIGGSPSHDVPAFARPPRPDTPPSDNRVDQPTNTRPHTVPFPAPPQPQLGCAAALICVEEQFCTMLGMISETPITLTPEQVLRRVPMVDCRNPDNGVVGKCCRDPNYVDPWPAGNLPANYNGGFDNKGFPLVNVTRVPITSDRRPQTQQSLRPQAPAKNFQQQQPRPIQPFQNQVVPQPSFQSTKIVPQQPQSFNQVQQPQVIVVPNQPKQPSFQPQQPSFQPQQPSFQPQQPKQPSFQPQQPQQPSFQPQQPQQPSFQQPKNPFLPEQPKPFGQTQQHQVIVPQQPKQPSFEPQQPQQPSFQPQQPSFQPQQPQKPKNPFLAQPEQPATFQPQQPEQPELIQQQQQPAVFVQPDQPESHHQPQHTHQIPVTHPDHLVTFKPQQPAPFQHHQPAQPQQPAPFQPQQPAPFQPHQPAQHQPQQPIKFGSPFQVTQQPAKTFDINSFADIPNQIAQLNPFNKPQSPAVATPLDDTETVNGPPDVPDVPLPAVTQKPGIFQDFPNNLPSLPSLPSFPSFPGFSKGSETSPTNDVPVVIAHHTPGARCGIINQVQHPGGLGPVDVAFGEIPWQAMILSNSEKKILCSGAIVAPNLILTAAHCVYGLNPSDVSIKAGEYKLGYELKHEEPLPFEIVQVESIVAHPNYQPGAAGFDTAMLFLQHSIRLDQHVDTICVGDETRVTAQRKCISTGWGKTEIQLHAAGALMHKIDVDVLSNGQCAQRLLGAESPLDLDDSLVCAKAHRQSNNMCQVDVGGPLACDRGDGNYELVGVYSQDTGCLPTNQVATFALIDSKWVNAMINSGTPAPRPEASYSIPAAPLAVNNLQQQPEQPEQTPSRLHYHKPGVPCDCQQGTQPSGANQYLPPV